MIQPNRLTYINVWELWVGNIRRCRRYIASTMVLLKDFVQAGEGIFGHTLLAKSLFCYSDQGEYFLM